MCCLGSRERKRWLVTWSLLWCSHTEVVRTLKALNRINIVLTFLDTPRPLDTSLMKLSVAKIDESNALLYYLIFSESSWKYISLLHLFFFFLPFPLNPLKITLAGLSAWRLPFECFNWSYLRNDWSLKKDGSSHPRTNHGNNSLLSLESELIYWYKQSEISQQKYNEI